MPTPTEPNIRLSIGGVTNDRWTDWSVDSDLLTPADGFDLELFTRQGMTLPATVAEGAPCTLDLDGDRVLTGHLDEIEHEVSRRGHTVRMHGRDMAGTLVDCSSPFVALREATLAQIIEQVVKPLGVSKTRLATDVATLRKRIQVQPGMTAWEALLMAAEANGLWPWVEADGTLVVGGPDYAAAPVGDLTLRSGDGAQNNVESLAVRRSMAGRYSTITVLGQHGAYQGGGWGDDRTTLSAKIVDAALQRRGIFRPHIVIDSGCDSTDLATQRAQKLLSDSKLDAFEARAVVPGWRASGGAVWAAGQRVNLVSEPHGLSGTYFVMGRTLRLGRSGGATSELRLRQDRTWVVDAHQGAAKPAGAAR